MIFPPIGNKENLLKYLFSPSFWINGYPKEKPQVIAKFFRLIYDWITHLFLVAIETAKSITWFMICFPHTFHISPVLK